MELTRVIVQYNGLKHQCLEVENLCNYYSRDFEGLKLLHLITGESSLPLREQSVIQIAHFVSNGKTKEVAG